MVVKTMIVPVPIGSNIKKQEMQYRFLVNRVLFACLIGSVVVDFFCEKPWGTGGECIFYPTTNEGELLLSLLFISSSIE